MMTSVSKVFVSSKSTTKIEVPEGTKLADNILIKKKVLTQFIQTISRCSDHSQRVSSLYKFTEQASSVQFIHDFNNSKQLKIATQIEIVTGPNHLVRHPHWPIVRTCN